MQKLNCSRVESAYSLPDNFSWWGQCTRLTNKCSIAQDKEQAATKALRLGQKAALEHTKGTKGMCLLVTISAGIINSLVIQKQKLKLGLQV